MQFLTFFTSSSIIRNQIIILCVMTIFRLALFRRRGANKERALSFSPVLSLSPFLSPLLPFSFSLFLFPPFFLSPTLSLCQNFCHMLLQLIKTEPLQSLLYTTTIDNVFFNLCILPFFISMVY